MKTLTLRTVAKREITLERFNSRDNLFMTLMHKENSMSVSLNVFEVKQMVDKMNEYLKEIDNENKSTG